MDELAEGAGLPFTQAIKFFEQKARIPTSHWTDVWRTAHARGFMVAGGASDALLSDFQDALKKALRQGTTLETFRKDFDQIVAKHGWDYNGGRNWRSAIIYQTNLSMAYAAGRYDQLTDPDVQKFFPYWQYVHTSCQHPRPQHLAWDGLTLRCDDPFWDTHYPPNGWRCGCRVDPVSRGDLERMGKDGPDTAPPIETREWRNPHTGEVHQVPVGIDPGFDYNVGKAWKEGDLTPPSSGAPPKPISPRPGAEMPPRAPEQAPARKPANLAPDYHGWVEDIDSSRHADGSARVIGVMPDAFLDDLGPDAAKPIVMNAGDMVHLVREAKRQNGTAIGIADLRNLPAHLARPLAVLREKILRNKGQPHRLLFVFKPDNDPLGRLAKLVVQPGQTMKIGRKSVQVNGVVTAGLVSRGNLQAPKEYELLEGDLDDDEGGS